MNQSQSSISNPNIPYYTFQSLITQTNQNRKFKQQKPFENITPKLLAALTSVFASEYLISNTIIYKIISGISPKKVIDDATRKVWINQQLSRLRKTMIRYNSIVFGTKVILDQYYRQTIQRNKHYHESNSSLHYKIGAMVGFIAYTVNIPINQFQFIQVTNAKNNNSMNYFKRLGFIWKEFLTIEATKRMLNSFSFASLAGVMLYRTIYFGGYQKIKTKYQGPLSEYLIAPTICSTLSLIVSPLDQIKLLQMTSHKDRSFFQIVNEKGITLWNLSTQKIVSSIVKQSLSMISFVLGQKACAYLLNREQIH